MTRRRWPSPRWLLWWLGAMLSIVWMAAFAFVEFALRSCSTDDECVGAIILLVIVGNAGLAVVPPAFVLSVIGMWWVVRQLVGHRRPA